MSAEHSVEICKELEKQFLDAGLHRPFRANWYDPGDTVEYRVTPVCAREGQVESAVQLHIESFVGGGFAGQVYRVKILRIDDGPVPGLTEGGIYALKILVPPSSFSLVFRNLLYAIGFQGAFQLQCNPAAARSGALWQKLIRRGARVRFGAENAVNDVHATFVDSKLGSCGEISDWIEGRTWQLEVDDRMDLLRRWHKRGPVESSDLGSPEYRAKARFMWGFVELLHEMGAHEFARQYEWSTWKSQPNCLKRRDTEGDPEAGLVAVDFRAGLALLPFLPMSPGDFKLILKGIARGSLVQFDRGDLEKLEAFVASHESDFVDLREEIAELKKAEHVYRNSVPDLSHNHVRILYSKSLWSTMLERSITGWSVRNTIDAECEKKLRRSKFSTVLFSLLGVLPFLGPFLRRLWGRSDWRRHYRHMFTDRAYFKRGIQGKAAELAIGWYRDGRIDAREAQRVAASSSRFIRHVPLSILPIGIHKFLTNSEYAKERLHFLFVRPVRLYFDAELRESWLQDMVVEGREKRILGEDDAKSILAKIKEPFIQKYLKSLAVHVCTVPITQVVSVLVAIIYVMMHPELPRAQAWGIGVGIIALFQVIPISPGSLARGLYVVYLVIRERNLKDYNIAVFLSFFKYVGYLAFPIQMTSRYPTLARFMAAHWATDAVHAAPVFGERGALLEHKVFCLFYNWPLTLRRRMRLRAEFRAKQKPRYWHVPLLALATAALFAVVERVFQGITGVLPTLKEMWWIVAVAGLLGGVVVTLGARGAALKKRIVSAALCGVGGGVLYAAASALGQGQVGSSSLLADAVWRVFVFGILFPVGTLLTELVLPEPPAQNSEPAAANPAPEAVHHTSDSVETEVDKPMSRV